MFWGGNFAVSPRGQQIAKGEYFKEQVVTFEMDRTELELARQLRPTMRTERTGDVAECYRRLYQRKFDGFP